MGEWLDTLDWDVRIGDALAQGTEALHFDVKTSLRHYGPLSKSVAERLGGTYVLGRSCRRCRPAA
jgi:hypothetical protein